MPNFKSTGGGWEQTENPNKGDKVVPAAMSLPVRHIQRKELNEGKVTVKPERRAKPAAKKEEPAAARLPEGETSHADVGK